MRFIVLAPFASLEADRDAAIISVLGDHSATTIYQLANADNPINMGRIPSDADLHANVVVEIIAGAIPVIHPELKGATLNNLLHLCQYLHKPVLLLEELVPALFEKAQFTQEDVDALNAIAALQASRDSDHRQPAPRPYPLPSEAVHRSAHNVQRVPTASRTAYHHDPGDEQPEHIARRVPEAPARTTNKARTLGDHVRAFQACLLRWEQRANAFLGYGLKNPNSIPRRAQLPPYGMASIPPSTTG